MRHIRVYGTSAKPFCWNIPTSAIGSRRYKDLSRTTGQPTSDRTQRKPLLMRSESSTSPWRQAKFASLRNRRGNLGAQTTVLPLTSKSGTASGSARRQVCLRDLFCRNDGHGRRGSWRSTPRWRRTSSTATRSRITRRRIEVESRSATIDRHPHHVDRAIHRRVHVRVTSPRRRRISATGTPRTSWGGSHVVRSRSALPDVAAAYVRADSRPRKRSPPGWFA